MRLDTNRWCKPFQNVNDFDFKIEVYRDTELTVFESTVIDFVLYTVWNIRSAIYEVWFYRYFAKGFSNANDIEEIRELSSELFSIILKKILIKFYMVILSAQNGEEVTEKSFLNEILRYREINEEQIDQMITPEEEVIIRKLMKEFFGSKSLSKIIEQPNNHICNAFLYGKVSNFFVMHFT